MKHRVGDMRIDIRRIGNGFLVETSDGDDPGQFAAAKDAVKKLVEGLVEKWFWTQR